MYSVNVNENISFATLQTDSIFPLVEIESPGISLTPFNNTIAFSKSDHQLETPNIGQHSLSVLEKELSIDNMLGKVN